jgi:hypothetical protein
MLCLFRGFSGASIPRPQRSLHARRDGLNVPDLSVRPSRSLQWPTVPGAFGVNVDPLGDVLMLLLPEGFMLLLAPAVTPPALPVVVELLLAPVPVAAPVPAPAPAPAAKAIVLESASAVANTIVMTFMDRFLCRCDRRQTTAKFRRSSPGHYIHPCDVSGVDPVDLAAVQRLKYFRDLKLRRRCRPERVFQD